VTDVTGFGLAGHLLEMLRAGGVAAEVRLGGLPLLPGVEQLVKQSVESTLAPANREAEAVIRVQDPERTSAAYVALFDPQTCGGMLLGVPQEKAAALVSRLNSQSSVPASSIGHVMQANENGPAIVALP